MATKPNNLDITHKQYMTALVSKNYEIMVNTLSWFGPHTQAQLGYRALEGRFYECNLRPPYKYLNV